MAVPGGFDSGRMRMSAVAPTSATVVVVSVGFRHRKAAYENFSVFRRAEETQMLEKARRQVRGCTDKVIALWSEGRILVDGKADTGDEALIIA